MDGLACALALTVTVIDGDTLRFTSPAANLIEDVRVANLDTPEIRGPDCDFEREWAREAKAYAEALLAGACVEIGVREGKSHGRTVARVYVDGRDYAHLMVSAGKGRFYRPDRPASWCPAPPSGSAAPRERS